MNKLVQKKKAVSWIGAGLWILLLGICSMLRGAPAAAALDWAATLVQAVCGAVAGELSPATAALLHDWTPWLLQFFGYMVLALLLWNALRFYLGPNATPALALALTCLTAIFDELNQIFVPGRAPRILDWVIDMTGAFLLLAGIWLLQWMWRRFPRLVNRETVSYVVFGALTTVVNIVAYQVSYNTLPFSAIANNAAGNTIAWVLSVLFAYVCNKLFVFQSKTHGARALLWEAGKFIGARVFSFAVDMAGMLLLVNALHVNSAVSKILMNIIVMIMNYFFSKWFIFKNRTVAKRDESA